MEKTRLENSDGIIELFIVKVESEIDSGDNVDDSELLTYLKWFGL